MKNFLNELQKCISDILNLENRMTNRVSLSALKKGDISRKS